MKTRSKLRMRDGSIDMLCGPVLCLIIVLFAAGVAAGDINNSAVSSASDVRGAQGDTEPNNSVDLRDLIRIRNALGTVGSPVAGGEDLDANGIVDTADMMVWRQYFPSYGDPLGPYLHISSPVDGELIGNRHPTIVVDFGPTTLHVDHSSLSLIVDGVDLTAQAAISDFNAVVRVPFRLEDEPTHYAEVRIRDIAGTETVRRSDFAVTSQFLAPEARPATGAVPHTAILRPHVVWSDVPPAFYLWDCDNNGYWDKVWTQYPETARPDDYPCTFHSEGEHTVRFGIKKVYDAFPVEESDIATVTIGVTDAFPTASPGCGRVPLSVFLHGIAADPVDPIVLYEWDYDRGTVFEADYSSESNPHTATVYIIPGEYEPVMRTRHESGAMIEHPVGQGKIRVVAAGDPTVMAGAIVESGRRVQFSGAATDDGSVVRYEWDFESDGSWDFVSTSSAMTTHIYPSSGTKIASLRATDDQNNTATDRLRIDIPPDGRLTIVDATLDPMGAAARIETEITVDASVSLFIRGENHINMDGEVVPGRVIRTLVSNADRLAGTYTDAWDGRDDRGQLVHPGAYHAVLEYTYLGQTDVIDLTNSTGGEYFEPERLTDPDDEPTVLDPLSGESWDIRFNTPQAARVSLYILPGGSVRTDVPFEDLVLGAGDHSYKWAGLTNTGDYVPQIVVPAPGETPLPALYLYAILAWTLPDNAIAVTGRPRVLDLDIVSSVYSPSDRPTGENPLLINLDVNCRNTVFFEIVNMESKVAMWSERAPYADAGPRTIVWNGRTIDGKRAAPGDYRLMIEVADDRGNLALRRYALFRVMY